MLARVVLRSAATARRFTTSSAVDSSSSVYAAVGRDVPLTAVARQARRQARLQAKQTADGAVKGVRSSSLPSKVSFALLAGSVSGSVLWHFLLSDATKKSVADVLGATVLGDMYAFAATKVEELFRPFTDPSREKLLPVRCTAFCDWDNRARVAFVAVDLRASDCRIINWMDG